MKTIFYPSSERGHADFGWLNARHSFSFGQWYDPKKLHFGALRVLNDDLIQGGGGFPTHPHDNMEIVTIPLSGAIAHKDSTGGNGLINAGDVQIMSAGSGVRHSEYNASATDTLNLLQIWVLPKEKNIQPRYDQKSFSGQAPRNTWQVLVSANKDDGGLWINQDAFFSLAALDKNIGIPYEIKYPGNGVYFFLIDGELEIEGKILASRDAIGVSESTTIGLNTKAVSRVLAIEVPMHL